MFTGCYVTIVSIGVCYSATHSICDNMNKLKISMLYYSALNFNAWVLYMISCNAKLPTIPIL